MKECRVRNEEVEAGIRGLMSETRPRNIDRFLVKGGFHGIKSVELKNGINLRSDRASPVIRINGRNFRLHKHTASLC
jgi:hypothetical protein